MSGARQNWRVDRLRLHVELVAARKRSGLTQPDVARSIGMSVRSFQRFEGAELEPSADQLFAWAAAVGLTITFTPAIQTGASAR